MEMSQQQRMSLGVPPAATFARYVEKRDPARNQAKFWACWVLPPGLGRSGGNWWRVMTAWGRIGSSGQQKFYDHFGGTEAAERIARTRLDEKRSSGYAYPGALSPLATGLAQLAQAADNAALAITGPRPVERRYCPRAHETYATGPRGRWITADGPSKCLQCGVALIVERDGQAIGAEPEQKDNQPKPGRMIDLGD